MENELEYVKKRDNVVHKNLTKKHIPMVRFSNKRTLYSSIAQIFIHLYLIENLSLFKSKPQKWLPRIYIGH